MKALLFGIFFLSMQSAFAGVLQDIGLRISIAPGVYQVKAGDKIEIPVSISVAHPELADTVELSLWGFNLAVDGANPLYLNFQMIDQGKLLPLPTKLVFSTTAAMMGNYSLKGQSDNLGEWAEVISFDDHIVIHVDNTPSKADVDGPVTGSISMKPNFKVGEPIQLEVNVADANPLCLKESSSPYCQADPVVAFICQEQAQGVCPDDGDTFIGTMNPLGRERYSISLKEKFNPGVYELELANFVDIWGNKLTGTSERVVFEVAP